MRHFFYVGSAVLLTIPALITRATPALAQGFPVPGRETLVEAVSCCDKLEKLVAACGHPRDTPRQPN
jgi:hypothetical protein